MSPRPQGPVGDYYMPEPNSGCWLWLGGLGKVGRLWKNLTDGDQR
jgi:hypothetical protein